MHTEVPPGGGPLPPPGTIAHPRAAIHLDTTVWAAIFPADNKETKTQPTAARRDEAAQRTLPCFTRSH